jgi:hypothetical protein
MYEKAAQQKALSLSGEKDLLETLNSVYRRQGYQPAKRTILEKKLRRAQTKITTRICLDLGLGFTLPGTRL